jgi:hypothetical protein
MGLDSSSVIWDYSQSLIKESKMLKKYKVSWKQGRKVGAIGIFYPGSVEVTAESAEAAKLKAYDTHEHLGGVTVLVVAENTNKGV